jgi:hypothetical protein
MEALLWLGATLAALWLLSFVLAQHIQGLILLLGGSARVAVAVYDLLVLPGVVLHELSHMLAALVLGVRVLHVRLFQFRRLNDPRQGEVVVANTDPVRMSLIGAAPLLGGVAVLGLLRPVLFTLLQGDQLSFDQLGILLGTPRALLILYLVVAVANTMFPSAADRQAWRVVALGVLAIGVLMLGLRLTLPAQWIQALFNASDVLRDLLWPVLLIDLLVLALVLLGEALVGRARGRRIVYRSLS